MHKYRLDQQHTNQFLTQLPIPIIPIILSPTSAINNDDAASPEVP
jgi:hypothetical protein